MADEGFFYGLSSDLAGSAACRCLTGCLHSAPFEALSSFVHCDATIIMAATSLTCFECDNTNGGKKNDGDDDDLHREAGYLRVLAHETLEGLNAVPTIPGPAELLAFALPPAVISAPCVEAGPFAVEFTQQPSSGCAANPALALSHVFQRRLADDLLCVVEAAALGFLLVPEKKHFALRWVFICVAVAARDDAQRVCLLFGEHEGDFGVCRHLRECPRRRSEAEIKGGLSAASSKAAAGALRVHSVNGWMPRSWGDEFSSPPLVARGIENPPRHCRLHFTAGDRLL
ncbi:hypothetical protein MOQ_006862 [Trypanosoma cruzi marinkellei]|uniref:Uncharacterized protein n=1 Tax=Trypanosoma cruzi marinkellei TaxID=85056 RepID=K2MUF0_TRYCR|nr:hypothetical protein MOQ_006862 [Trypanosoma cruzi marinkellei]